MSMVTNVKVSGLWMITLWFCAGTTQFIIQCDVKDLQVSASSSSLKEAWMLDLKSVVHSSKTNTEEAAHITTSHSSKLWWSQEAPDALRAQSTSSVVSRRASH
jgi:hypothetical protein